MKKLKNIERNKWDTRGWGIVVTHWGCSSEWQLWHFQLTRESSHSHFIHSPPTFPQISSAMIRSCWGQPWFDLPPVPKFKFYKQRWRLAIGHFGQTNIHDWPQNYAANPSLTLPMAPGIAAHLQTAENPLVHNLKLDLKESEAKVVRAQCAVSQFNGCSRKVNSLKVHSRFVS